MKKIDPCILWFKDKTNTVQFITFPATMEEMIDTSTEISKYPVQNGFEISNHVIRKNKIISLKVYVPEVNTIGKDVTLATNEFITDGDTTIFGAISSVGGFLADPLGTAIDKVGDMAYALEGYVSNVVGFDVGEAYDIGMGMWDAYTTGKGPLDEYEPEPSRIKSALTKLKSLQDNAYLSSLSTVHNKFHNLILTDIKFRMNSDSFTLADIELTFEQVVITDALGNVVTRIAPIDLDAAGATILTQELEGRFDPLIDSAKGVAEEHLGGYVDSAQAWGAEKALSGAVWAIGAFIP